MGVRPEFSVGLYDEDVATANLGGGCWNQNGWESHESRNVPYN